MSFFRRGAFARYHVSVGCYVCNFLAGSLATGTSANLQPGCAFEKKTGESNRSRQVGIVVCKSLLGSDMDSVIGFRRRTLGAVALFTG